MYKLTKFTLFYKFLMQKCVIMRKIPIFAKRYED